MKTKKTVKILSLVLLVAMICTVGAFAEYYESGSVDYNAGGHSYYTYSTLNTNPSKGTADPGIFLISHDYKTVPAGYMGAQPRLFASSGNLIAAGTMRYNDSPSYFIFDVFETSCSGYVYSMGLVSMYTGTTYLTYNAPQTVMAPVRTSMPFDINKGTYPTNNSGETYGSALLADFIGYEPDLIAAVGIDGTEGYVRASEIEPNVRTPEEALAYMAAYNENRLVSLYDAEGDVIGTFELEEV